MAVTATDVVSAVAQRDGRLAVHLRHRLADGSAEDVFLRCPADGLDAAAAANVVLTETMIAARAEAAAAEEAQRVVRLAEAVSLALEDPEVAALVEAEAKRG